MKARDRAIFGLSVALVGLLFWAALSTMLLPGAFRGDFLNLYTGGLLARTGHLADLHNFELQKTVEDQLVPGVTFHMPFVRPHFYALLLSPISLLPVKTAFPVWLAVQTLGFFAAWVWAWRRFGPDAMVYCAFFVPAALGIAHGQDCVVLLLILLAAWVLLERGRDFAAGLVLGLALFKFHLFLLLPVAILLRRRWNLFGGFALSGASLAAFSALLGGAAGVRGYIDLLTRKDLETLSPSPELMVGMNALGLNLGIDSALLRGLLLLIPITLVVWSALRSESDRQWFWAAVMGSMLVSPHTFSYDLAALLVPGLHTVFESQDRPTRIAAATTLVPLGYFATMAGTPWAIAPSLIVLAFLVTTSGLPARRPSPAACPVAPAA